MAQRGKTDRGKREGERDRKGSTQSAYCESAATASLSFISIVSHLATALTVDRVG